MPHGWRYEQTANLAKSIPQSYKLNEFATALSALMRYREAAAAFHAKPGQHFGFTMSRDRALYVADRAADSMYGSIGGPLGESLHMLTSNEVLLRDVHFGNIGWRFLESVEGEEGYPCLVIFDPGHTPTGKRPLPAESWVQLAQLC
jgi:hypothetical protein